MNCYSLPTNVTICGKEYVIADKCEHRMILDVIDALEDARESKQFNMHCAMLIFFEDCSDLPDPLYATTTDEIAIIQECMNAIISVLNCGKASKPQEKKPKLINWKHDYDLLAAPVSRVLGYSVRDEKNYTHWYDYVGATNEVGDCYWSKIIGIRMKKSKGKKLDENERELYINHREDIDLPMDMSDEEKEWLDEDW